MENKIEKIIIFGSKQFISSKDNFAIEQIVQTLNIDGEVVKPGSPEIEMVVTNRGNVYQLVNISHASSCYQLVTSRSVIKKALSKTFEFAGKIVSNEDAPKAMQITRDQNYLYELSAKEIRAEDSTGYYITQTPYYSYDVYKSTSDNNANVQIVDNKSESNRVLEDYFIKEANSIQSNRNNKQ